MRCKRYYVMGGVDECAHIHSQLRATRKEENIRSRVLEIKESISAFEFNKRVKNKIFLYEYIVTLL